MDIHSPEQYSKNMRAIKATGRMRFACQKLYDIDDDTTEMIIRSLKNRI